MEKRKKRITGAAALSIAAIAAAAGVNAAIDDQSSGASIEQNDNVIKATYRGNIFAKGTRWKGHAEIKFVQDSKGVRIRIEDQSKADNDINGKELLFIKDEVLANAYVHWTHMDNNSAELTVTMVGGTRVFDIFVGPNGADADEDI